MPGVPTADGLADDDLSALRTSLRDWYQEHHRSFPWRETTDPYAILVAEVMSQQTQLDRIVEPWEAFLERWPTVEALAEAARADVVAFWSAHSLGYNNRARYLHEAAQQIQTEFDGAVPSNPDELTELMGVGPYTANAVASFAFDTGNAVVDTNVERVLYRVFDLPDSDDAFETTAQELKPPNESRIWNNAIMELGALACTPTPRCDEAHCPWRETCGAYRTGDFTVPDGPTQPAFEGSRRQYRGRIVRTLGEHGSLPLDEIGHLIREDYTPHGDHGQEWIRSLLSDLEDDGLVTLDGEDGQTRATLRQ